MRILVQTVLLILLVTSSFGGASRSFDDTNDSVNYGVNLDITTDDATYCAWTNMTEDAASDHIIGNKNSLAPAEIGYMLHQVASTDIPTCRVSDSSVMQTAGGTTDLDGAWNFVCCTWNGTTDDVALFVNGVQEATDTTGLVGSITTVNATTVGEEPDGGADANGNIAYVQMWNRVLSQVELLEVQHKPCSIPNGLLVCSPLLGESPEPDWSGNGVTGTVAGSVASSDGPPIHLGGGGR